MFRIVRLSKYGPAALTSTLCVKLVNPSVQCTVHGPKPVKLACNTVASPLQIVLVVTSVAVGRGLTVTRFVPVMSLATVRQLLSITLVTQ